MSNKPQLGFAIVGFGGMGSQHAKMIGPVEDFCLKGIFDPNEARQNYAESLAIHVYAELDDLLSDSDVDVVLIATPNHLHHDLAVRSLRTGKHVICEKPAMLNSAELEDVINVAAACSRVFVVHQNRRWDEDFRSVKRVFDEGSLGKIFSIESRVMGSQGIPGDWRTKKECGGGMLLDWGIHLTDQMLWMVPGKVTRIYCRLGYTLGSKCDDSVKLFLTFDSGIEALIEVGTWNMETLPRWYMAGIGGAMTIRDFWFTESTITRLKADVLNNTRPVDAGKGITKTMAPRDPDTLEKGTAPHEHFDVRDFYRNVAAAIRGEAELIVGPQQSLRVMRVMDAARRSAETDSVIYFEE